MIAVGFSLVNIAIKHNQIIRQKATYEKINNSKNDSI